MVAEICRYGAFGGTTDRDDDELLWTMAQNLFRDYLDQKLTQAPFIHLMTNWLGIPHTWPLAAGVMQPETRGPTAYLFGNRYQQLGRPREARSFFKVARDDSSPDKLLGRRAQAALDRLDASK
jgi:hypothetical protein